MKILIADDDVVSARMLQRKLESWECEVVVVHNGIQALQALQDPNAPRLLVLDWMMPGMDGPEIIRQLREQKSNVYNYTILLTSRDQQGDIIEGLEAGADDYLRKPFNSAELHARLRAGQRILDLQENLLAAQEDLRIQATQDPLTALANRRHVLERLNEESARCHRDGHALGVLMLDLDHFKHINDTHGHGGGDEVLRAAAVQLKAAIRGYDTVGRFGGEEFLVVLPNIDRLGAIAVAERIRISMAANPVTFDGKRISFRCSVGVAVREVGQNINISDLIHHADMALYRSKEHGRNQVTGAWTHAEAA